MTIMFILVTTVFTESKLLNNILFYLRKIPVTVYIARFKNNSVLFTIEISIFHIKLIQ